MINSPCTVAAALSVLLALAVHPAGQSTSSGRTPRGRTAAWERQLVLSQKVSDRLAWAARRLQPSGLKKLDLMGRALAPEIAEGAAFEAIRARARREIAASFAGLGAGDVSEAASIVLSLAARDMEGDIRLVMAEIKAMTAAGQKMRDMIEDLNGWISEELAKHPGAEDIDNDKAAGARPPSGPSRRMTGETRISPVLHFEYVKAPVVTPLPPRNPGMPAAAVRSLREEIRGNLDGLNEISETTSARLQLTMDRRAGFVRTLSTMIRKLGRTQEALVRNIK